MKQRLRSSLFIVISLILLLSACSGGNGNNGPTNAPTNNKTNPTAETPPTDKETEQNPEDIKGDLLLWDFGSDHHVPLIEAFRAKYPNINVVSEKVDDTPKKLLLAVTAGTGAPDVSWINEQNYGNIKAIEGFENLLDEPYNAGQYQAQFSETVWNAGLNTKKELIGFPFFMNPYVTFYRKDIIEAAGFPSEPEELGEFISSEENFFELVGAIRAQNPDAVFFRFPFEISWMLNTEGFYNDALEYQRNNDHWVRVLELTKRARTSGALPIEDLRGDAANQAMANGNLVMYHNPSSAADALEKNAPDTKGLWRMTTLPFVDETPGRGYTQLVIPSQSKNKEAAWAFIKYVSMDPEGTEIFAKLQRNVMAYKPAKEMAFIASDKDDFFGGQEVFKFIYSLVEGMKFPMGSPFENSANELWGQILVEGLAKNMDSRALMTQLMEKIEAEFKNQKQQLLK